jgi:hypothetical protein
MIKKIVFLVSITLVAGCAYSIKDVDVSDLDPTCVRECSTSYSSCVSQGNQVGFKTETLRACQDSYVVCTNTCPPI